MSNFASDFKKCIQEVIDQLTELKCTTAAVISDNAPSLQKAIKEINNVAGLRCAAHIWNLTLKDAFKEVDYAKRALDPIDALILEWKLKRYPHTRWNARYDRLQEALHKEPSPKNHIFTRTELDHSVRATYGCSP